MAESIVLAPWQPVSLSGKNHLIKLPIDLDPQTSVVRLRVKRPSAQNTLVQWDAGVSVDFSVVVELDGEQHRADFTAQGGPITNHHGITHEEWVGYWELPSGFFGRGEGLDPSLWPTLDALRLGETSTTGNFRAWVEMSLNGGQFLSEFQLEADIEPAPDWEFHHSIAFDTQTSTGATSGSSVSMSFTASSAPDRVATVFFGSDASMGGPNHTVTYGGAAPSRARIFDVTGNQWSRCTADIFMDTEIGSGAKTIQGTASFAVDGGLVLGVMSFVGVHQTTPTGTPQSTGAANGNPSVTVSGVSATDLLVDGWYFWSNGTQPAVGADQVQRVAQDSGGNRLRCSTQIGSAGGVMSYTGTGAEYSGGAFALKDSGTGPPIMFVGVGALSSGTGTSLTPALPSGVQQGDLLLAVVVSRQNGGSTWTFPSGWAQRAASFREIGSTDLDVELWWKIAGAGETDPAINIGSGSNGWAAAIAAYRGVDQSTPFDIANAVTGNAAAATTLTPNGVTTVTQYAYPISVVATPDDNALALQTDQGFTAFMSGTAYHTTAGQDMAIGLAGRQVLDSPGAITFPTWQETAVASDPWCYISDALKPEPQTTPVSQTAAIPYEGRPAPGVVSQTVVAPYEVRINPNKVAWNGESWYLHGANFPWRVWEQDFGHATNGVAANTAFWTDVFSDAKNNYNMRVLRVWMMEGTAPQITRGTGNIPTGITAQTYADMDALLQICANLDMYVHLVLFSSFQGFPQTWFTDATQRQALANVIGAFAGNYANNPHLMTIEIINEPEWDVWNNGYDQATAIDFVERIHDAIKANSSVLTTVGSAMCDQAMVQWWGPIGIDFYSPHWYDYMDGGSPPRWDMYDGTTLSDLQTAWGVDRPIVVGEFFAGEPGAGGHEPEDKWPRFIANGWAGSFAWSFGGSFVPPSTNDGMVITAQVATDFGHANHVAEHVGPRGSGAVTKSGALPMEATQNLRPTGALSLEALQALARSQTTNIEILQKAQTTTQFRQEGLGRTMRPGLSSIEALSVLRVQGQGYFEALQRLAKTGSGGHEALYAITLQASGPQEALESLSRLNVSVIEALGGVAINAIVNIEGLSTANVQTTALLPIEAIKMLQISGALPQEAIERVIADPPLALEALKSLTVEQLANHEGLVEIAIVVVGSQEALEASIQINELLIEALGGVVTGAPIPMEVLGGTQVTTPALIPLEAMQALRITSVGVIEALNTALANAANPLESLIGVLRNGGVVLETLKGLRATGPMEWESLQHIGMTALGQHEGLSLVTLASTGPLESLYGLAEVNEALFEALGGVALASHINYEGLGTAGVTTVGFIPIEALEILQRQAMTLQEAIVTIADEVEISLESVRGIVRPNIIDIEGLIGLTESSVLPQETQQGVFFTFALPQEAQKGIGILRQVPVEALGLLYVMAANPMEALAGLHYTAEGRHEVLLRISSNGKFDYEALVRAFELADLNMEVIAETLAVIAQVQLEAISYLALNATSQQEGLVSAKEEQTWNYELLSGFAAVAGILWESLQKIEKKDATSLETLVSLSIERSAAYEAVSSLVRDALLHFEELERVEELSDAVLEAIARREKAIAILQEATADIRLSEVLPYEVLVAASTTAELVVEYLIGVHGLAAIPLDWRHSLYKAVTLLGIIETYTEVRGQLDNYTEVPGSWDVD